jgi:uncharacterized tellurite resistance protein B-like protein
MLGSLRKLIADFGADEGETARFGEDDYRLAAAALLVHAAAIDGGMSEAERAKLNALLKQRFGLDDDDVAELVEQAIAAEREAVDLYRFTARLDRTLDERGRARLIEMMWQIVFTDGAVTEFEDNLIWRAADLLHVSRHERIALRDRVAGARSGEGHTKQ